MFNKILIGKKAQTSALVLILLFLIAGLFIVAAQNSTNVSEENVNLCQDVICSDSNLECPDGTIVSCSNSCDSRSGECSDCILTCEGHEVVQPSNDSEPSESPNETASPTSNVTEELSFNETQELNDTGGNETGQDFNFTGEIDSNPNGDSEDSKEIILSPNLEIEISSNTDFTRGNELIVSASIKNSGDAIARNVFANWIIPDGFEISSGHSNNECGNLEVNDICNLELTLVTSTSTLLGENEIKLSVSYNE